MSATLTIAGLAAGIPGGRDILFGVDLEVPAGEVHAVMGPNGSGKSTLAHVIMGRPGYERVRGSVRVGDTEVLVLPTWKRAQAGLFLGMQYPTEVPGVRMEDVLREARAAAGVVATADEISAAMRDEAAQIGFDDRLLSRSLNVDLSGGEKKRNEMVQLGVLHPKFALLDEVDSGLDVDALRAVSRRIENATKEFGLGVLAITHYNRLLAELKPDRIHVFVKGRVVASGPPELALELERTGYEPYLAALPPETPSAGVSGTEDPYADPFP